ncbi:RnfH family protein [Chitinimonas lacunae]|uniref:UPF0125 protein ACFOW7_19960 n=1 Tax=Chitinimonas lacunae TaxID=1963018 RepID=A0ABV8MWC8_9NEIS
MSDQFKVEVAYATPRAQRLISLQVEAGCTAESAIRRSGLLEEFPEIDLAVNKVGIFSRACKLDTVLRPNDRVEIYRPLIADPKEVRRRRVAEGRTMRRGSE